VGWNAVFENVEVAQRALEALKRGDGFDSVLGSSPATGKAMTEDKSSSSGLADKSNAPDKSAGDEKPGPETGAVEKENPFSAAAPDITENKAQNHQTMVALDIKESA
jgi:hypothetical protein